MRKTGRRKEEYGTWENVRAKDLRRIKSIKSNHIVDKIEMDLMTEALS